MFNPKQFVQEKKQQWNELDDEQKVAVNNAARSLVLGGFFIAGVYYFARKIEEKQLERSADDEVEEIIEDQEEI